MKDKIILLKTEQKRKMFKKIRTVGHSVAGIDCTEVILAKNVSKHALLRLWRQMSVSAHTVILPESTSREDFLITGIKLFRPATAISRLCVDCALDILSQNAEAARSLSVCLADKSGRFAGSAERFMPLCRELKILTSNPTAYFRVADGILARHGAEPIISDNPGKCDFVVLPFSGSIFCKTEKYTVTESSVTAPAIPDMAPADAVKVMIAHYEKTGERRFDSAATLLDHGGEPIGIGDIQL